MSDIDHNDIKKSQKAMAEARKHLAEIVGDTGHALAVIEMDSDRRKRLLARYTKAYLAKNPGKPISHAHAETLARADDDYGKELDEWEAGLEGAYATRKDWEATESRLEVARSIHSVAGKTIHRFEE
jgi:hypothetical protein